MYHQASSLPSKRASSPGGGRVWSHNTGYTGAAGIHSEVGTSTHARNVLTRRRASNVANTEEEIFRKEMRAMNASRKSLESSMLLYSQKMRDISERRSQLGKKPATPFNPPKHKLSLHREQDSSESTPAVVPISFSVLDKANAEHEEKVEAGHPFSLERSEKLENSEFLSKQCQSRLSMDSGISVDSGHEGNNSDAEGGAVRGRLVSARSVSSEGSSNASLDKDTSPERQRGRGRDRIRFRDSKTSKLAPVVDEDIKENDENETPEEEEEFQTPRIAPFPDELIRNDDYISPLVLNSIMECDDDGDDSFPGRRTNKRGTAFKKDKKKPRHYVYYRPKPIQSPSVTALRHRFFERFGPNSVYFRYSEEVLDTLRGLSQSPRRQKSDGSSPCRSLSPPSRLYHSISPTKDSRSPPRLHGIDFKEVLRAHETRAEGLARLFFDEDEYEEFFVTKNVSKPPSLDRERSFSAPSSKCTKRSSVSKLEDVIEHDDSKLQPVLKKDENQYSTEKKNVQFFLPHIFMRSNMCTSQPQDFTLREQKTFTSS